MPNFHALAADLQDRLLEESYEAGVADAEAGDDFHVPHGTGPECEAAYREGYESVRLVPEAEAAPMPALSPTEHREAAVAEDADDVLAHMLLCGPLRFDARRKVEEAEAYTLGRRGSSLAVPSKLAHVGPFQDRIEALEDEAAGAEFFEVHLCGTADGFGLCVLAEVGGVLQGVGYVQAKHAAWLAPLLSRMGSGELTSRGSGVRVYVTAVTGGTAEKPTRGVNVVFCGVAEAARKMADRLAAEDAIEAAYESGSVAAVEAALA